MPLAPPTICQAMREAGIFWPAERDLLNRITADADLRRQAGHLWHTDLLELILSLFAQHATAGVLLDDCPDLERHDVLACLGSAPAAIEWLIWSVKIARSREEILASLATQPVLSRFEEPQAGAPPNAKWYRKIDPVVTCAKPLRERALLLAELMSYPRTSFTTDLTRVIS